MLTSLRDLDPTLYSNADKTFCDPACGDGNFLVRFLHWKWELNEERAGGWTPPIKRILRSIWGVDLMPDNVEVARSRLIELTASLTGNSFEKTAELYSHIVSHNVVCHDSLTWNFEEWRPPTEEEIEVLSAPPKKKRASRKSMSVSGGGTPLFSDPSLDSAIEVRYARFMNNTNNTANNNFSNKEVFMTAKLVFTTTLPVYVNEMLTKETLSEVFGTTKYSGICVSDKHSIDDNKFINLFHNPKEAEKNGYADAWNKDGSYSYAGMGLRGDQTVEKGLNKSVLEHAENGRTLHVFHKEGQMYRYEGEFRVDASDPYKMVSATSPSGKTRQVVMFRLLPVK
jgi:hypothetical protein